MRIGTFFCWLFGHKFLGKSIHQMPNGIERIRTLPTDFCIRCGKYRKD